MGSKPRYTTADLRAAARIAAYYQLRTQQVHPHDCTAQQALEALDDYCRQHPTDNATRWVTMTARQRGAAQIRLFKQEWEADISRRARLRAAEQAAQTQANNKRRPLKTCIEAQSYERTDPTVNHFMKECGL